MPQAITERELRRADLPPTEYVVGIPLYPVGGTVFMYGAPGVGKSFITQGLNHTIAWGIPAGSFTPEYTANVLYCDFEGTQSLVKERSLALTPFGSVPGDHDQAMPTDTDYVFGDQWRGRTFAERLAELEDLLVIKENQGIGYSLVILDTYTAFVGSKPGQENAYDYDRACIEALNLLAAKCQVCILLIHHPNKSGEMSGSMGRAGTAWIVASFQKIDELHAMLSTEKNRVGREIELTYERDASDIWRLSTRLDPKAAMVKGNMRAVLQQLAAQGPQRRAQLIEATGIPGNSMNQVLARLKARGDVEIYDGHWRTSFEPGNHVPAMPVHSKLAQAFAEDIAAAPDLDTLVSLGKDIALYAEPGHAGPALVPSEQLKTLRETYMRRRDELVPPVTTPAGGADNVQSPNESSQKRTWRDMGGQRKNEPAAPPEINTGFTLDEQGNRQWDASPISVSIDLIMHDRDTGRLTPTWRAPLPDAITPIDGQHRWGQLPQRYLGTYRKQPNAPWVSYDVRGSFLAAYRTPLAIKTIPAPKDSDGADWTRQSAGFLEVLTPEWGWDTIGHPMGSRAVPGSWQWIASPTYRLLTDLANAAWIAPVKVRKSALRTGYQEASEAVLEGFQDRMRAGREHYDGDGLVYIKEMYSAWLSTTKDGNANVFKRPDWWYAIRAEAFARLWANGRKAVEASLVLLGMGNTDELCIRQDDGAPELLAGLFPPDDRRIGKMTAKDQGPGVVPR